MLNPIGVAAPSAKNSTMTTDEPAGGVAVAVIAIGEPTSDVAPLAGAVILTEGVTVTATIGDVFG